MLWAVLLRNHNCISMKSKGEMKRETDSWRGCLVEHSYYESINPYYNTLLFHSFTTCCYSSNGNIAVTLLKSHFQYLLFFLPQLKRNVNKRYKPGRAVTSCHWAARFNQAHASYNTRGQAASHASKFTSISYVSFIFGPKSQIYWNDMYAIIIMDLHNGWLIYCAYCMFHLSIMCSEKNPTPAAVLA